MVAEVAEAEEPVGATAFFFLMSSSYSSSSSLEVCLDPKPSEAEK